MKNILKELLTSIKEMTMRGGNLDNLSQEYVDHFKDIWYKDGKYTADIGDLKVRKYNYDYSLWKDDTLVASIMVTPAHSNSDLKKLPNYAWEINRAWVNSKFRNQKLFSKMLWFLKTRENYKMMVLSDVHSEIMQEILKTLVRFEKYWYNVDTGEKDEFNKETTDNYYGIADKTNWRVVLEGSGNFSDWPRFRERKDFVKEDYNWVLTLD